MSKVLVLLADGFEDIEMITTIDILRRGKVEVDLATIHNEIVLTGTGTKVVSDMTIDDVDVSQYDLLFLPGGKGVQALDEDERVKAVIRKFMVQEKYVSAICAAPLILGKMGILDHRVFTCYPSFEKFAPEGVYKVRGVIQDGKVITGRGVAYALDFGLHLLKVLEGPSVALEVEEATLIKESKKGLFE